MDINSLPSNSFKSKQAEKEPEKKDLQPVVNGPVKSKKPSPFRKMADILINPGVDNLRDYIVFDVVIPAIRSMFSDALISSVEMIFGTRRPTNGTAKTSYTGYWKSSNNKGVQTTSLQEPDRYILAKSQRDFDNVIVENRWEAEEVIDQMVTCIQEYGSVSIADFYDLVSMPSNFTDNKYGWTNLATASIERVGGGYLIKLPPTVKLD